MKTNYQRGYRANHVSLRGAMLDRSRRLTEHTVYVHVGNDFTNGHRGEARAKRGAKKHLRTQERHDGKASVREALMVRNAELDRLYQESLRDRRELDILRGEVQRRTSEHVSSIRALLEFATFCKAQDEFRETQSADASIESAEAEEAYGDALDEAALDLANAVRALVGEP